MNRSQAYRLLNKYLQNKNLIKHSLAAEAAMKGIYKHLTPLNLQNIKLEAEWGITGLLHDIDYEVAQKTDRLSMHGKLIFEPEYEPHSIPAPIARAIKSHNYEMTGEMPENDMEWAIYCVDQLTGLIVAGALVHPDRKLTSLTSEYVLKRFGEKSFAKGARRESILLCEEKLGIPLKEFISIVLDAMKKIHDDLGL